MSVPPRLLRGSGEVFCKLRNLFLMLRFVGIKVFDKVCLVSPFLVLPCKFAQQHILLLDGMQLGIVVGDDAGQADGNQPNGKAVL